MKLDVRYDYKLTQRSTSLKTEIGEAQQSQFSIRLIQKMIEELYGKKGFARERII